MGTSSLLFFLVVTSAVSLGCQSDTTAPVPPPPDVQGLSVAPSVASIDGGHALKLTARLRLSDGTTTTVTGVTWLSADGTIASVGSDGVVVGLRAGKVRIAATWHEVQGSSLVTVLEPAVRKPATCLLIKEKSGSDIPSRGRCVGTGAASREGN